MPKRDWIGPFKVQELLSHSIDGSIPLPPESGSAYLVSQLPWEIAPTEKSKPLYVGGTTGRSQRFRTRVGDLLADLFGFFGQQTGHHSGGQSLHRWCKDNQVNPLRLYLAWVRKTNCNRCLEVALVGELNPLLNKKAPAKCTQHASYR